MTERNIRTNRTDRIRRRSSDRARAITRAKSRKQTIAISVTALVLVAVAAASFIFIGASNAKPQTADTAPTAVSTQLKTDAASAKANNTAKAKTAEAKAPAQTAQPAQAVQTAQPAQTTQDDAQMTLMTTQAVQPAAQQTATQEVQQSAPHNTQPTPTEAAPQNRIDNVNGERVFIDTKRTAPETSGTPYHFYANGKTSYGFDWTYNTDNSNFVLRCDYNFNQQQYDFQFYGVTPGTAHVTVYYNTDDNVQVPVSMTIVVDDNLNVTAA